MIDDWQTVRSLDDLTAAIEALRLASERKDPTPQEAIYLQWLGLTDAVQGEIDNAQAATQSSYSAAVPTGRRGKQRLPGPPKTLFKHYAGK